MRRRRANSAASARGEGDNPTSTAYSMPVTHGEWRVARCRPGATRHSPLTTDRLATRGNVGRPQPLEVITEAATTRPVRIKALGQRSKMLHDARGHVLERDAGKAFERLDNLELLCTSQHNVEQGQGPGLVLRIRWHGYTRGATAKG